MSRGRLWHALPWLTAAGLPALFSLVLWRSSGWHPEAPRLAAAPRLPIARSEDEERVFCEQSVFALAGARPQLDCANLRALLRSAGHPEPSVETLVSACAVGRVAIGKDLLVFRSRALTGLCGQDRWPAECTGACAVVKVGR